MPNPRQENIAAAHDVEEEEAPQLPLGNKDYVACRKCHTILTYPQYMRDGCFKCTDEEKEAGNVTTKFTGFIGLVAPEHSWVARTIGCAHMPSGVYAAVLEEDEVDDDDVDDGGPFGRVDHARGDPEDEYDDADDDPPPKVNDDTSKKRSRDEIELDDILEM